MILSVNKNSEPGKAAIIPEEKGYFTWHGGNVWEAAARINTQPEKIIDFSASLNPLGPPPEVVRLIKKNIRYVQYYPEPGAKRLRAALARWLGVPENSVIVGNGASEIISLFFWVLQLEKVLLPAPVYNDYARAARAAGSAVENISFWPDGNATFLARAAGRLIDNRSKALVFCNPNNPTGLFWEDMQLFLAESLARGAALLLDLSFLPFTSPDWLSWLKENCLPFIEKRYWESNLLIVLSLTKIFALPGLRLGVALGPPPLVRKLEAARDPWSVNVLAQLAGQQCLQAESYLVKTLALVQRERGYLYRSLKKLPGLVPFSSAANFLLVDCRQTGLEAAQIAARLAPGGYLIRPLADFEGLDAFYLRLAVRKRSENQQLLLLLKEVIDKKQLNGGF